MSFTYHIASGSFYTSMSFPVDGDDETAASIVNPVELIADNTAYLRSRTSDNDIVQRPNEIRCLDGTNVVVSPFSAVLDGVYHRITSSITVDITSFIVSADTWYYLYVYPDSATTYAFTLDTVAPTGSWKDPSGSPNYLFLGSLRGGSSNQTVVKFNKTDGEVMFLDNSGSWRVLTQVEYQNDVAWHTCSFVNPPQSTRQFFCKMSMKNNGNYLAWAPSGSTNEQDRVYGTPLDGSGFYGAINTWISFSPDYKINYFQSDPLVTLSVPNLTVLGYKEK